MFRPRTFRPDISPRKMSKVDVSAKTINCGRKRFHTCVYACMGDALSRFKSIYFLTLYNSVLEALGYENVTEENQTYVC